MHSVHCTHTWWERLQVTMLLLTVVAGFRLQLTPATCHPASFRICRKRSRGRDGDCISSSGGSDGDCVSSSMGSYGDCKSATAFLL